MGSQPYLKDFVRGRMLNDRTGSGRLTVINREKVGEVNDCLQTHPGSSIRSVAKASSRPQITTCRIMTEHLLLKPYKAQFVQQLHEEDRVEMLLPLLTKLRNKNNIVFVRMKQQPFI